MTLAASEPSALFFADPPPQIGQQPTAAQLQALAHWADRTFQQLQGFLRRPEFPGVVLTRVDSTLDPEFKAENGFLIYAGPGVLGPQEGLYVRESGAWKKLAGT